MERIGNAGWFMTDEEHDKLIAVLDLLSDFFEKGTLTSGDGRTIPYDPQPIKINESYPQCPNCPWKNPADWTWRPWQAPWYGPGEPVPTDWKIGDGEWWKNSPYCTSTTEDNPNAVKQTKTTGDCNCNSACNCQEK